MPTFYVTAVPPPGFIAARRPTAPRDIIAKSKEDAIAQAESHIAEDTYEALSDDHQAVARKRALRQPQWSLEARLVRRPAVELRLRATVIDVVRDGKIIGQHYDYGEETATESFDVLLDGAVRGHLDRRAAEPIGPVAGGENMVPPTRARPGIRVWVVADALESLATLEGRQWVDGSRPGRCFTLDRPHAALSDVRAALEAGHPSKADGTV